MKYLKVWTDFESVLSPLDDAEAGRLFRLMLRYARDGEEPDEFVGNEVYLWPAAKRDIDMTAERNETLRQNGLKGGRPKTKENQSEPSETKENQTEAEKKRNEKKGNEKETETENIVPLKRFIPPTVDEVALYCSERHNHVNAEKFVDYYTANGWTIGGKKSPMKDWRAAIRLWERSEYTEKDYQYERETSGLPY